MVRTLDYLDALEGALRGLHWDAIPSERKAELRREAGVDPAHSTTRA